MLAAQYNIADFTDNLCHNFMVDIAIEYKQY